MDYVNIHQVVDFLRDYCGVKIMTLPITHRPFDQNTDEGLIFTSWIRETTRICDSNVHWVRAAQRALITKLLNKSNTIIACAPDYPLVVYGYIVYDNEHIHAIYVRGKYRYNGVATYLINAADSPKYITHLSSMTKYVLPKFNLTYDPTPLDAK